MLSVRSRVAPVERLVQPLRVGADQIGHRLDRLAIVRQVTPDGRRPPQDRQSGVVLRRDAEPVRERLDGPAALRSERRQHPAHALGIELGGLERPEPRRCLLLLELREPVRSDAGQRVRPVEA
jgi:hypothetical protein